MIRNTTTFTYTAITACMIMCGNVIFPLQGSLHKIDCGTLHNFLIMFLEVQLNDYYAECPDKIYTLS